MLQLEVFIEVLILFHGIPFYIILNAEKTLIVINSDKIEKNEMGGTCGTYGGRERCAQGFGGET